MDSGRYFASLTRKIAPERETLARELDKVRAERTIVHTNGVFDILHSGHVSYLARARDLGDLLVVSLNSDASVRRLNKGPDRPLNRAEDRALVLAALECVDYVTFFSEDTPLVSLEILRPAIHVKGGDYTPESLPETPTVLAGGGRVEILPFVPGFSTSSLVERIRRAGA